MTTAAYRRRATEAEIEAAIKDAVEALGGRVWHVRDSRRMDVEDMLDLLVIVPAREGRPGIVALLETKSQYRPITAGQKLVLDLLTGCTRLVSGVVRLIPKPGELSLDDALSELTGGMTQ